MSEMNSFQDAFYIMAKELGFDYAQPLSPREVFETQMLPRIKELVATQPAAGETVGWIIDWPDEPELGHYFGDSPAGTGSRSRPLYAAPPAAAHGDEAVLWDGIGVPPVGTVCEVLWNESRMEYLRTKVFGVNEHGQPIHRFDEGPKKFEYQADVLVTCTGTQVFRPIDAAMRAQAGEGGEV